VQGFEGPAAASGDGRKGAGLRIAAEPCWNDGAQGDSYRGTIFHTRPAEVVM
jgi:hypothetical protein